MRGPQKVNDFLGCPAPKRCPGAEALSLCEGEAKGKQRNDPFFVTLRRSRRVSCGDSSLSLRMTRKKAQNDKKKAQNDKKGADAVLSRSPELMRRVCEGITKYSKT